MDKLTDLENVTLKDILMEGDTEDRDYVLEFSDGLDYADCEIIADNVLAEWEFDDLMAMNDMDELEAVTALFYVGEIGLPVAVDELDPDEDNEAFPEETEE